MKYRIRKSLEHYEITSYVHADEVFPENLIDCSLGINPFGFSPKITKEVFAEAYDAISAYPDFPYEKLRQVICDYLSPVVHIKADQVALHGGSMGVIWNLDKMIIDEETNILAVAPTFSSTLSDMRSLGGHIDMIELSEKEHFRVNVEEIVNRLSPKHHVIYLDNPNNPTGQIMAISDIEEIAKKALAQDTYLIIDEAYGDFMDLSNSAVTLVNDYPNVIAIKTFSKGFGLAGLRVGYLVMHKDFEPYMALYPGEMTVNGVATKIIPMALADREHIEISRQKLAVNKKKVLDSLTVLHASVSDLSVPIVLLYTEKDVNLYQLLMKYGIKAERGEDFDAIGQRHVRLRIPSEPEECIRRLKQVELELK